MNNRRNKLSPQNTRFNENSNLLLESGMVYKKDLVDINLKDGFGRQTNRTLTVPQNLRIEKILFDLGDELTGSEPNISNGNNLSLRYLHSDGSDAILDVRDNKLRIYKCPINNRDDSTYIGLSKKIIAEALENNTKSSRSIFNHSGYSQRLDLTFQILKNAS